MREAYYINPAEPDRLVTQADVERIVSEQSRREQLYSLAVFNIPNLAELMEKGGDQPILELYNKLLDTIGAGLSGMGGAVPVPTSADWKENEMVSAPGGIVRACQLNGGFVLYVNYLAAKKGFSIGQTKFEPNPLLLGERNTDFCPIFYERHSVYLAFLQMCMEFFCQAMAAGVPLRGCISTGMAVMDQERSLFFGSPLVEATVGAATRQSMGVSFGRSFYNYHPVYHDYFIPWPVHLDGNSGGGAYLSPMVLDWARYWRGSLGYGEITFTEGLAKMRENPLCAEQYDVATRFFEFSEQHEDWHRDLEWTGQGDILDYCEQAKKWYYSVKK